MEINKIEQNNDKFYHYKAQLLNRFSYIFIPSTFNSILQNKWFHKPKSQPRIPFVKISIIYPVRSSQIKRQSSRCHDQSSSSKQHNVNNISSRNNQKHHNQKHSRSSQSQPRQINRYSNHQYAQNTESQYVQQTKVVIIPQKHQNTIVCDSIPISKPKYSFTFGQAQSMKQSIVNSTPRQLPNRQKQHPIIVNSQKRLQSRDIRKDIDVCLYTIADKLNQQYQSQQLQQSKQFVTNKLGTPEQSAYKPSISQLRKNKKLFVDKSIHRIHPQIVDEYIQTVYRDYSIPDPINQHSQSVRESQRHQYQQQQVVQQNRMIEVNKKYQSNQKEFYQNIQRERRKIIQRQEKMQRDIKNYQQKQNQIRIQKQKQRLTQQQKQISQQRIQQQRVSFQMKEKQATQIRYRQNQAIRQSQHNLHNTKNTRKNNLISQKQEKIKGKSKKRFLNLTLSKQKESIKAKKFQSPQKNKKQDQKVEIQDGNVSSKSRSVRKSSSQKKIMQIKKNISSWKDSEHQFAERYSYLESPYEQIRGKEAGRGIKDGESSSGREVNVIVRPFEEMMKMTVPTQHHQISIHGANTTLTQYVMNTTSSQFKQDSKYIQSFFVSTEGQILEEFRFCILCEQPVLSANLIKHEQKCIGWIDDAGQLIMFKDLYNMNDDRFKTLMKQKIKQIQQRVQKLVERLRRRQQQTAKQSRETLESKILHSVENFIHSYSLLQQNNINVNNKELFSSSYKGLQKITRNNQSLILLEQTKKLHWFIRLLDTYQNRSYQSNYQKQQDQHNKSLKSNGYISTQAKHNQSLTFVHQEHQKSLPVSEFVENKNSNCC